MQKLGNIQIKPIMSKQTTGTKLASLVQNFQGDSKRRQVVVHKKALMKRLISATGVEINKDDYCFPLNVFFFFNKFP